MAEKSAFVLKSILGTMATDDGSHVLIGFEDDDGQQQNIAIEPDRFMSLFGSGCLAVEECFKKQKRDPNKRPFFPVSYFELGQDVNTKAFVLTLTFGVGGRLSFQLDSVIAGKIHETLATMLGVSIPQNTQGRLQ